MKQKQVIQAVGLKKETCLSESNHNIYKLQNTDTPAAWGTYDDQANKWIIENVSYDCATNWYKYTCGTKTNEPTCNS